jgi:L-arabinose isomerase
MKALRKPKIGIAGVMCTPFRGDKEGNFRADSQAMEALAADLDFELFIVAEGIYTQEQAEQAARRLGEAQVDFILLQASSFAGGTFIYPFASLPIPLGLWAVPEGPPAAGGGLPLNSFTAANLYNSILRTYLTGYNRPVKWFLGHPGQPLFDARLAVTIQAFRALINLRGAQIGLIGGVAPGFDNLRIDERRLQQRLGIRVFPLELDEVLRRAVQIPEDQAGAAAESIRQSARQFDSALAGALHKSGQVYLALEAAAAEQNLDALAVSCWPRFQADYQFAVCSVMGHLNTAGLIAACEGDVTSAVSMLALRGLTNGSVITLMDLSAVDEADESVLLWHCGPTSPALADERGVRMQSLWLFDQPGQAPIGLHNDLVLRPGRATVMGFTTDFERILVLEGDVDNIKPGYTGSRGWFRNLQLNETALTVPDLVQTLMVSGFQHHYPLAYGSLSAAALELAAWLGIKPVQLEPYTTYVI